ncbi:hypothetical protein Tco_0710680 [Tanacetum coccineum]
MTTSNNNGTERAHDPQAHQNNEVGVPRRPTNSHRKEYKSQFQTLGTEVTILQGVDHLQGSYPQRKAKKRVKLIMQMLFRMELELMLFWSTVIVKTINGEVQLDALVDGKKIIITESSVRRDLQLADEEDKAIHKELGDSLVRAATTTSSIEVEQDSGGGPQVPRNHGDTIAQTRFESVSKHSNDSLLLKEVLDLEKTKTTQHNEIAS